jgi:DNA repair photolyase
LREELKRARRTIESLNFSFTTDPYLPIEANYELTRNCLKVCRDFRIPVGIVTKSPLVARDIDVLAKMNATVYFSIPFLTVEKSKPFEPYVPVPEARFRAMKTLTDAGIETGIALAPVIPSYSEPDIPALLEKARGNGATRAFMTLLRLPTESLREYFTNRLEEKLPTKKDRILNQIRRERGGKLNSNEFGARMSGTTENWRIAVKMFDLHFKRLGFTEFERREADEELKSIQQNLFD